MFGVRTKALVSIFSLLILICLGFGQTAPASVVDSDKSLAERAKAMRVLADQGSSTKATRIKNSSPLYRDAGTQGESSWLGKAFERIGNLFKGKQPEVDPDLSGANLGNLSSFFIGLAWFLLATVVGACIFFAVKHFKWRSKLKRQAVAILQDDEPDRSLDEWLSLADQLELEGRHREAVRALYLAILLRFDEYNVARFDRRQTNWEHLHRIVASPKLPTGIDFLTPTKAFDLIWYGFKVNGSEDVTKFRNWYTEVVSLLQKVAA